MKIDSLLTELDNEIRHLKTPILRANAILTNLKAEKINVKNNTHLIAGARKGLVEMFNEINKVDSVYEIDNAIAILEDYVKNGSFQLQPVGQKNKLELFELIKKRLEEIVTGNEDSDIFLDLK